MRNSSLACGIAALALALAACTSAPSRQHTAHTAAANQGAVHGELVEAKAQDRYALEQGVSYEQPAAFPDNPKPVYPPSLLPKALPPVTVSVQILVSAEGTVSEVRPAEPATGVDEALFFDSVRTALLQWKFFPLVKVMEGGPSTVLTVGDVSTTYDGQASRLPFSQTYRFVFSQVAGVPSVGEAGSQVLR